MKAFLALILIFIIALPVFAAKESNEIMIDYQEGMRLFKNGQSESAYKILKKVVQEYDRKKHKEIITRNEVRNAGYTAAEILYEQGNIEGAALSYYDMVKNHSDKRSSAKLAKMLFTGEYTPRYTNMSRAGLLNFNYELIIEVKAKKGDPEFMYFYANILEGERKSIESLYFYEKAFEGGYKEAELHIPRMKLAAKVLAKKQKREMEEKNLATKKNKEKIEERARIIKEKAKQEEIKKKEEKIAKQEEATRLSTLFKESLVFYNDGDYKKALAGFEELAIKRNHKEAQYNLALMLQEGQGADKSYKASLRWHKKAGEQGIHEASYNAGIMFEYGLGTEINITEAKSWYRKASKGGHLEAKESLERLGK